MKTKLLLIVVIALIGWSMCSRGAVAGTLQIIHSIDFPVPEHPLMDIAWDGQYLLVSMPIFPQGQAGVYAVDPSDGSTARCLAPLDLGELYKGLTWDGRYLWATWQPPIVAPSEEIEDFVLKIDSQAMPGPVTTSFEAPHSPDAVQSGAAWDGAYLWISDWKHQEIMQLDPADMSVITSFSSPGTHPLGLTWGGSSLWCADDADDRI